MRQVSRKQSLPYHPCHRRLSSRRLASTRMSTPPSAKKIKTEWGDASSDTLLKQQAETDSVKTDEDTVKFLRQMSSC